MVQPNSCGTTVLNVPHTVPSGTGSAFYFGVITAGNPFTGVTFTNTISTLDGVGFDDMTIGREEQIVLKTETCDGVDNDGDGSVDEGFPDTDGDGIADCVDRGDDGDSILDTDDECPLLPTTNTITGTAGNDTLIGTPANDLIRGLGGNDKIRGKGGDDCLVGVRGMISSGVTPEMIRNASMVDSAQPNPEGVVAFSG